MLTARQVEQELAGVKEEYATIGNLTMNMLVESNKELDLVLLRAVRSPSLSHSPLLLSLLVSFTHSLTRSLTD